MFHFYTLGNTRERLVFSRFHGGREVEDFDKMR